MSNRKQFKRLALSLLSAILSFGLLYITLPQWHALMLIGVIVVHEMGHYNKARRLGLHPWFPIFLPLPFLASGFVYLKEAQYWQRAKVALAGPLYSLVLCALLVLISFVIGDGYLVSFSFFLLLAEIANITIGSDARKYRKYSNMEENPSGTLF